MDNSADFAMGYTMGESNNRNCGNGWGNGWGNNSMEWLFALMILPAMYNGGGLFGGNREDAASKTDLCMNTSFSELKGSVGRGFDQQTQFAFQNQRDMCQSTATLSAQAERNAAAIAAQQASCCCDIKQLLMENRYLAERNAANSDAVTTATGQKILDAICGNRMADMQNQINQLQLQQALCGIPRTNPYGYGIVPQFAGTCNNGYNNI